MPKDWLRYKAEIHRHYIVEEKTVSQVREILKRKHSFSASVRAYRMKFDEWGMRKYKSQKSRSNTTSSTHTTASVSEPPNSSSPHPSHAGMAPVHGESSAMEVDSSPMSINDVLALINTETASALNILETILTNWLPDPEFTNTLKGYFADPDFNKWVSRRHRGSPEIFQLIQDHVEGRDNQFCLIKILLEADLATRPEAEHALTLWQESWCQAYNAPDWDSGKNALSDDAMLSVGPRVFLDCAEVVIAERFLKKYEEVLSCSWINKPEDRPQRSSMSVSMKREYATKIRDILRSFYHAKDDVCPRFYRSMLRLDLELGGESDEERRRLKEYGNEYRQKYILLSTTKLPPRSCSTPHNKDKDELELTWTRYGDTSKTANLPITPPTSSETSRSNSFPTLPTATALGALIQKWHTLTGFETYTEYLLSRDGTTISIFTPPSPNFEPEAENIFDAMMTTITDYADRISLAKGILVVSSIYPTETSPPDSPPSYTHAPEISPLLSAWQTLYPSPATNTTTTTIEKFRAQLVDNVALAGLLNSVVKSDDGRKLVMDAMISLVGERLLGHMKGRVAPRDGMKRLWAEKNSLAVMKVLTERGIVVDPVWRTYIYG